MGINWDLELQQIALLALAFVLTLPTALEREHATRLMGIRTFPLVAMATCAFVLIAQSAFGEDDAGAQARIIQGIITGIGFIGGGAILKMNDRIVGTATAASVWLTGALGVAVGYGNFSVALFLCVANFMILRFLCGLKDEGEKEESPEADGGKN